MGKFSFLWHWQCAFNVVWPGSRVCSLPFLLLPGELPAVGIRGSEKSLCHDCPGKLTIRRRHLHMQMCFFLTGKVC